MKRAQKAETSPVPGTLDPVKQTARFYGSNVYDVSLSYCPCGGFHGKHPCKHIYRLAMELGIIDLPFKTGVSKGEYNETQISFEDCVAAVEQLSENAQRYMMELLSGCTFSSREERADKSFLVSEPSLIDEFRQSPLFSELPVDPSEILNRMKRDELRAIIDSCGISNPPKKNASNAASIAWMLENIPDLLRRLPPLVKFSFSSNFIKGQRPTYTYLSRKLGDDLIMLDDGTIASIPCGSLSSALTISISLHGVKSSSDDKPQAYYFPDDAVTALLTKYGCNRCLNGFIPSGK